MISLSVNQLVSETRKAILGKGYSFGMAEDIAASVQWLAGFGIIPHDELSQLMVGKIMPQAVRPFIQEDTLHMSGEASLNDILAALDFCEAFNVHTLCCETLSYPYMSLALMALRASPPLGQFTSQDGTSLSALCISGIGRDIVLTLSAYKPDIPASWPARIHIDEACYKQLKQMAYETYVPSSEQSRAAGAGAGLNDND